MYKNMVKRTWLSIIRKPSKSIVLILIMFVMANLVLASLSIKNAVNENIEYAKETLGSEIYLTSDMDALMEEMEGSMSQSEGFSGEMGTSSSSIVRPEITMDMVTQIGSITYVKDLTYSATSSANLVDLNTVDETEDESEDESMGDFSGMQRESFNMSIGDIFIEGINAYAFIDEVSSGEMEIYDGDYFDESTDDSVMISYEFAVENDLSVGDTILLTNVYDESDEPTEIEVEIIGIFTTTESGFENIFYMNIETASSFMSEDAYNDGDYIVSNAVFYLNNPDDSDAFIEEAYEIYPNLEELYLTLDINNDAYEEMAGPIEQVGEFADVILICVIVASIVIVTLLINNNVKDRKYEIGVLSSLGATKNNIASQILLELIITTTIGFVFSLGTSYFIADSLSQSLLDNQISSSEVTEESSYGRPSTGSTGGISSLPGGTTSMSSSYNETDVEVIDEIDVSVNITSYLLLFSIGYLTCIIAMLIPTMNIVKYEPKTILTGRQ